MVVVTLIYCGSLSVSVSVVVCHLLVFALVPRLVEHHRELCVSYEP